MTRQSITLQIKVPEEDQTALPPGIHVDGTIEVKCYATRREGLRAVSLDLADRIEGAIDQQIQDVGQEVREAREASE